MTKKFTAKNKKCYTKYRKKQKDDTITYNMKCRLDSLRPNGRLVWSLSPDQIIYIKTNYNYTIEPYIYKIRTCRFFFNKKTQPAIIKELIQASYQNKDYIFKYLKKSDLSILDSKEIEYKPIKYIITVQQKK